MSISEDGERHARETYTRRATATFLDNPPILCENDTDCTQLG
jgi:hypothetical protein